MRLARSALVIGVALSSGGCLESPLSPPPRTEGCGGIDLPCIFECETPCVQRAVDLAEGCVVTLEGKLDETRRSCEFDDGTLARFAEPLASSQAAADHQTLELELLRPGGEACLRLRSEIAEPGRPGTLQGTVRDLRLSQEVSLGAGASDDGGAADAGGPRDRGPRDFSADSAEGGVDSGPVEPSLVRVTCGGKVHERSGTDLCARCGDAGCPALLGLRVLVGPIVEVWLEAGPRTTPLFTCRESEGSP